MWERRIRLRYCTTYSVYTAHALQTGEVAARRATGSRAARSFLRTFMLLSLLVFSGCAANASAPPPPQYRGGAIAPRAPYSTLQVPLHWARSRPLTLDEIASVYLSHMSLDDKLGQLFVVALSDTDYNANNAAMVERMHAGAIILYTVNMVGKEQTRTLIATAQAHATLPLLVLTDEEGGWVDRLIQFYGRRPSASEIGYTNDPAYATAQGLQTGKDMRALGFNADFAPDVDVEVVHGPDQSTRTFGSTPEGVTKMAGAYLTGMQQAGIVTCLKHFPGLGAATVDAHSELPKIDRTLDQIESVELAPYRNLIATGQVQMIMSTDLLMTAIDPVLPAEISPAIMTGVLRNELGFNGVVVTDALYMQGIAKKYSMATAAAMAIEAGNDMLEGAFSAYAVNDMKQAILDAMSRGDITPQRIDESVRRILLLKMRMGILPIPAGVAPVTPLGSMTPTVVDGPVALAPRG